MQKEDLRLIFIAVAVNIAVLLIIQIVRWIHSSISEGRWNKRFVGDVYRNLFICIISTSAGIFLANDIVFNFQVIFVSIIAVMLFLSWVIAEYLYDLDNSLLLGEGYVKKEYLWSRSILKLALIGIIIVALYFTSYLRVKQSIFWMVFIIYILLILVRGIPTVEQKVFSDLIQITSGATLFPLFFALGYSAFSDVSYAFIVIFIYTVLVSTILEVATETCESNSVRLSCLVRIHEGKGLLVKDVLGSVYQDTEVTRRNLLSKIVEWIKQIQDFTSAERMLWRRSVTVPLKGIKKLTCISYAEAMLAAFARGPNIPYFILRNSPRTKVMLSILGPLIASFCFWIAILLLGCFRHCINIWFCHLSIVALIFIVVATFFASYYSEKERTIRGFSRAAHIALCLSIIIGATESLQPFPESVSLALTHTLFWPFAGMYFTLCVAFALRKGTSKKI